MSGQSHGSDLIREWLDETYEAEREPGRFLDHVIDVVPATPQRQRRWWHRWHRVRSRRTERLSASDTIDYQPSPVPATNGHTLTVIRRTHSMLSPAKAVIAAALVFGIGGVMLVAQPSRHQPTTVPAAEGDAVSMKAAWVSGTVLLALGCTQPERTIDGAVVHEVGYRCKSQLWETDDLRLNGRATPSWNADVYRLGPDVSVSTGIYEVETDTGRWLCSSGATVAQGSGPYASTNPETITCEGQDAYSGLAAVLDVDLDAGSIEGLVFAGDLPQSPEAVGR